MSNTFPQPRGCALLALAMGLGMGVGSGTAAAATFTVNNALDIIPAGDSNPGDGICEDLRSGVRCTLRAAIEEANASAGDDTIAFSVNGTIAIIGSPLPVITDKLAILGVTAPGFVQGDDLASSPPSVFLSGTLLDGSPNGLQFRNANASGSQVLGLGIVLFGGSGIASGVGADGLVLRGNYIGTTDDGNAAGNGTGVFLVGNGNQVGLSGNPGISSGIGNVVSASAGDGITLVGNGNRARGNMIGVSASGSGDRGNGGRGMFVIGNDNLLGDFPQRDANVVTFNADDGIRINGDGNTVRGNDVGGAGLSTFGNGGNGIAVYGTGNLVGDLAERRHNRIRGNALSGVRLGDDSGIDADATLVVFNIIRDNAVHGINVELGTGNRIARNEVFGNAGYGMFLQAGSSATRVVENLVGLLQGPTGIVASGNTWDGINERGTGNWIGIEEVGGEPVLRGNIVGANGLDGIRVDGSGVRVAANLVGVGGNGEDFGNNGDGINVLDAAVGALVESNVVGFNALRGVRVYAHEVLVCGNSLGTTEAHADIGNGLDGLHLPGNDIIVGEGPHCAGNLIGFNGSNGIRVLGSGTHIGGNVIGGDARSSDNFGNDGAGVLLQGAAASGTYVVENSIAANTGAGVRISANAGTGNDIVFNEYRDNGVTGIDIGEEGFTPNDPGDIDEGANHLQNTPELLSATLVGGTLEVSYRVDSSAVASAYPIRVGIQLADGSGRRQGIQALDRDTYTAPGTVANVAMATALTGGRLVAIATDALGNTSEFSAELSFGLPDLLFADGFESTP